MYICEVEVRNFRQKLLLNLSCHSDFFVCETTEYEEEGNVSFGSYPRIISCDILVT